MRNFSVPDNHLEAFERIMLLARVDAIAEIKRLNVLGSAYWDRPAGQQAEQIKRIEAMRDVANDILEQMK